MSISPVPWPEVAACLTGPATVIGATAGLETGLPPGWRTTEGREGELPVVLVAPRDGDEVHAAHRLAGSHPLVVVLPNLARPELLRALLVGRGDDVLAGPARAALTRATVDELAGACARVPAASPGEPAPTATGRPLDDLLATISWRSGGHDRPWLVSAYLPAPREDVVAASTVTEPPFLTVLVRTQGRRPATLADVLLCLSAQTSDDFDVLLLAHDVAPSDAAALDAVVADLPDGLRRRTVVVPVTGGGRVRPLTVGVARAGGSYLAVLDDDDLVLGGWVDAFRRAAVAQPGSVVRSICVEQHVEVDDADPGFRATSWPNTRWDREFSLLSHLVDNHSPVHAYAVPREVFTELGLGYDETLPVLEDWDLLVRAASLVGVRDTDEVTAVYRRWPASRSSFAELPESNWPETAWRVVAGWDAAPLLLPAGSATRLREDGIYVLRHQSLRVRFGRRFDGWRDRWSGALMRTPVGRPVRWGYRRLRGRTGPPA
jgi:hypothetical protein